MDRSFDDQLPRATSAHSLESAYKGSAICIGLASFLGNIAAEEEPPADALPDLPYAGAVTRDLAAALTDLGFFCAVYTEKELPSAQKLGSCVSGSIASATSEVHVVHVLSHGHPGSAGVYAVGADGCWDASTWVESWVASVEDDPHRQRPHTLFVIDTCYSGQAARLGWLKAATEQTRAWVIAASEPDGQAFNGRLTQAVTTVLRKLKSGELDFSPSTYVPFVYLVDHVRREVIRLGGASQYVTGTPVDGLFEPPLFANPRPTMPGSSQAALTEVDPLVSPFTDLDPALDPAHFLDRASGRRDGDLNDPVGFFTGRHHQIEELAGDLDSERPGLTVITGGAGSGKSALLGVLVCALHPRLRDSTQHLWRQVTALGSAWTGPLAAVHLRERTLDEATSALIRQLLLPLPSPSTPQEVTRAVSALPEVPLIIFDALDEAAEQDAVHRQLLRPLAAATRLDGSPAAYMWIGTRPWRQFADLLLDAKARGHLINLDAVPASQLRMELHHYVEDVLVHADAYEDWSMRQVRHALAQGVAEALTTADRARGGEFLIAALYTHWLQHHSAPPRNPGDLAGVLAQIPVDVPAVLDLDLSTREDQPWLTALLVTLAHAHGAGMPATVMRRAAGALHPDTAAAEISVLDFDRLLRQVRFYLRSTPDSDGTSLYRLFHQSLVEHLNDPDADLSAFVDRILATVPIDDHGRPMPEAAEPYIQRHWIQHAADAGRIDLLVNEPPAELVLPLNAAARTRQGRLGAAVYRQSAHLTRFQDIESRRQLLSADAVRYRAHDLAQHLAEAVPGSHGGLFPQWATGGSTTPWIRALIAGHYSVVASVAVGQVDARPIIVSSSFESRLVRIWDAQTGAPLGHPITGHQSVVASVAVGQVEGRTIIISGSYDKTVRVRDAATGKSLYRPLIGRSPIGRAIRPTALAVGQAEGRTIIVSGYEDGTVRVWDAATGSQLARHESGAPEVKAIAVGQVGGDSYFITEAENGNLLMRDLATGTPWGMSFASHAGPVDTLAIGQPEGRTIIVTSSTTRTIEVYDAASRSLVGQPLVFSERATALAVGQVEGRTIIVSGYNNGAIRIWDPPTGPPLGESVTGHSAPVTSVAAGGARERAVVVTGSLDSTVRVWNADTGDPIGHPLTGHGGAVRCVAVGQANGRTIIVSGSDDKTVQVWEAATGISASNQLSGHTGAVCAVAVGQMDGRAIIVSGSADRTVRIWEADTGDPIGVPLTGHGDTVRSVAVGQANGQTIIVSGSADKTVRVWDPHTGKRVCPPLSDHSNGVDSVAIGQIAEQGIIVSVSRETIWVWQAPFDRKHIPSTVTYRGSSIAAFSLGDVDTAQEIFAALASAYSFSIWRDGHDPIFGPDWTLPYRIDAICHLPTPGWAVAFGNEIAVFRPNIHPEESRD